MTVTKNILNVGLAAQAANLALSNIRRKKKKNIVRTGIDNIVGTSLIQTQSQFLGGL